MGLISIIVPVASRVNRVVLQTRQLDMLAGEVPSHDFEFLFNAFLGNGITLSHSSEMKIPW